MDIKIKKENLRASRSNRPCRIRPEIIEQCIQALSGRDDDAQSGGNDGPSDETLGTATSRPKSRVRDLTGQTFGTLTVVSRAENSAAGKARWNCKCSCGTDRVVLGGSLLSGRTKSCRKGSRHPIVLVHDVVGEIFGELTVIAEAEPHVMSNGKRLRRVTCQCSCGTVFECGLNALIYGPNKTRVCKECRSRAYKERRAQNKAAKVVTRKVKRKKISRQQKKVPKQKKAVVSNKRKSQVKDLTGQRFCRLLVVRRVADKITPAGKHQVAYECVCDCGKTLTVRAGELLGGQKSCGCLKRELTSQRFLHDLTGQRFGMLTVLHRTDDKVTPSGSHRVMYRCLCDCGTVTTVAAFELRNGQKSCGCSKGRFCSEAKIKDLSGQRFGKLTAIELTGEKNRHNQMLWKCRCECGHECIVSSTDLLAGHRVSCGCARRPVLELHVNQYFDTEKFNSFDRYETQVRFDDLTGVSGGKLSYDFGLYFEGNLKCLIECQGKQHYEPVDWFGGPERFEVQKIHDELKREYAANHGIRLVEVPYTAHTYEQVVACLQDAGVK